MKPTGKNIIIGRHPVVEAIREGRAIERIFMQRQATGEAIQEIKELARNGGIPINLVPPEKLNSLTRGNHQGIVAMVSAVTYMSLQDVISFVVEKGEIPLFLMLDGITDVRNIGAIARTALCCGAQAIIIPEKGVAPLQEDAMKASAGALEKIMICRVNSLMKAVDELHLNGIMAFASEMNAKNNLDDLNLNQPCAIVMGSESRGVFPPLRKICDQEFRIPMKGDFESLNVSVAAGMILYETMKQRGF